MKKFYSDPEMEIRNYLLPPTNIVMTSYVGEGDDDKGPSLSDGDDFDYFS